MRHCSGRGTWCVLVSQSADAINLTTGNKELSALIWWPGAFVYPEIRTHITSHRYTGTSPAALASRQCGSASTTRSPRSSIGPCLSSHIPSYPADDWRLVTDAGVRRLRSADNKTLVVGCTQSSFGDRKFAAAAPRLWNNSWPSDRLPNRAYTPPTQLNCRVTSRRRSAVCTRIRN